MSASIANKETQKRVYQQMCCTLNCYIIHSALFIGLWPAVLMSKMSKFPHSVDIPHLFMGINISDITNVSHCPFSYW